MNLKQFFIFISVSLLTWPLWAKDPVYFLPEKNNLQILPQKFEYNLLNNSTIKIGDIVIDSNNLSIELVPEKGGYSFTFTWPAGLFQNAELVIFNNYGKAIKNYTIKKDQLQLIKEDEKTSSDDLVRKDKAIFKSGLIEETLIDEIKYLPFLKFCLQRKEEDTRIDLCSVELYFSSKDGKPAIKMRSGNKKKAQILINNAKVGEQGIIFLNDLTESINFKGQSESGARLEIETRLKPVDFKDVIISDDGKSLLLTAHGSLPVSDKNVKKLEDNKWQIALPVEFPVFYIQGEGDIPFRQEFFIRGLLPVENLRTFVNKAVTTTYSSSADMYLELPKGVTVLSKESNSKVSRNGQKTEWTVTNLEKGKESKRVLYLEKDKNEYVIYHSIFRSPAFEAHLAAAYASSEKLSVANLGLNYWLNNQRSGLALVMEQALTKTDTIDKWSVTQLSYLHRFSAGMNFTDSSYYAAAHMRSWTMGDLAFSQMGLGIGQKSRLKSSFMRSLGDWQNWSLNYFMGAKSNGVEIKSLMKIDYRLYATLSRAWMFDYGLNFYSLSTDAKGMKTNNADLGLGVTYLF